MGVVKVQNAHRQEKVLKGGSGAYLKRGFSARLSEKRYERLLKKADVALKVGPEDPLSWEMKGFALLRLGRFDEALEAFGKVAELAPENGMLLELRSFAHYALKYYQGAVRTFKDDLFEPEETGLEEPFEITLAKDPLNAEAWNYRGVILSKLGGYEKALKAFDKALELNPEYGRALENRQAALGRLES